ncbi:MAG: bifunctional phosphoglucose/phosphomannose isomerase [Candidatus Aenigmarchaeota archaeon]|nr:bifunctional phosphoglucose/phosphomannose isomerase [Candidatus Aenigmarchaeota archaeon]
MMEFLKEYPDHIQKAFSLAPKIKLKKDVNKIVVGGMGGSAISGDILRNYLEDEIKIPVFVVRNYKMPNFVDKKTLVFMISYSGNTEESLYMMRDARRRGSQIVLLTSGGKFARKKFPIIKVPRDLLPRVALPYLFFPILRVLQDNGFVKNKERDVKEVSSVLKGFNFEMARQIAKKFFRRTPVLYGPEKYRCSLYRWETQLNENSKKFAHFNCFTEMNHNEIVSDFNDNKDIFAVIIKDEKIHKRVNIHMRVAKKILEKEIEVREIKVKGNGLLSRLFYIIYLGDCVSYYLSLFRAVDPAETNNIKIIKSALKRGK